MSWRFRRQYLPRSHVHFHTQSIVLPPIPSVSLLSLTVRLSLPMSLSLPAYLSLFLSLWLCFFLSLSAYLSLSVYSSFSMSFTMSVSFSRVSFPVCLSFSMAVCLTLPVSLHYCFLKTITESFPFYFRNVFWTSKFSSQEHETSYPFLV